MKYEVLTPVKVVRGKILKPGGDPVSLTDAQAEAAGACVRPAENTPPSKPKDPPNPPGGKGEGGKNPGGSDPKDNGGKSKGEPSGGGQAGNKKDSKKNAAKKA